WQDAIWVGERLRGDVVIVVHRHDVYMRVRHIEAGDHHANLPWLCHRRHHRRESLDTEHQVGVEVVRQQEEIWLMLVGDDQRMTGIDWAQVQESGRARVFEEDVGVSRALQDLAEGAVWVQHIALPSTECRLYDQYISHCRACYCGSEHITRL